MSTSIAETVSSALTQAGLSQYQSHARPVVTALNEREASIAESLIGFATQQGMAEEDAAAALREMGMTMPAPPPTIGTVASASAANQAASGEDGDLAAVLGRINSTLEDLAGFARQNGWRPSR